MGRKTARNKKGRDVEVGYSTRDFVEKLRRLADALEQGGPFVIQIANERVRVPAGAVFNVEHERAGGNEEIEFQLKWSQAAGAADADAADARPRRKKARRAARRR